MPFACPKDPTHVSSDPDYCSECGAKIGGGASHGNSVLTPSNSQGGAVCPDCRAARVGGAKFCEVCRYNFEAATSSTLPPKETASIPTPVTTATPNLHAKRLDVVVRVDPSLYTDPDPNLPCPIGSVDQLFPIDLAENLIGRRSGSRGIFPEISLDDPGVSHRHAKLFLEGGALWVLDLGSTNGTRLNGVDLKPGVKTELKLGDFVTLGCWTRLIFRER